MYALANTPVLNKDEGPQEKDRRIEDGVRVAEEIICEASNGDKEECTGVGREKCKVESNSFAKLEIALNKITGIQVEKHT